MHQFVNDIEEEISVCDGDYFDKNKQNKLFDNYFGLFVRPVNGKGCKGHANEYKICNKQVRENVGFFFYFETVECSKSDLLFLYIF